MKFFNLLRKIFSKFINYMKKKDKIFFNENLTDEQIISMLDHWWINNLQLMCKWISEKNIM